MLEALPDKGIPGEQILAELRELRAADLPTHGGRLFAYVYDPALDGLDELARQAHAISAHVNGLDPTAFPSLLAMENALVGAAARLLGGDDQTVGSVTSGGTESLILAVKAARDAQPDLKAPRLVIPSTAHAAFAKAAHYLRVALDVVPVGADLRADRPRSPKRSAPTRFWSPPPPPPTPTEWSTRSPRSPRSPPSGVSASMWTRASAAGCCPI